MEEGLFKIIKKECSIAEAMSILGADEKEINNVLSELKDSFSFQSYSLFLFKMAHNKLIKLGKINEDDIINTNPGENRYGDIGFLGDKMYRFTDKWEEM